MKKSLPIVALLLAVGLALPGGGAAQGSLQEGDLASRVDALERALAEEQQAHAETRAQLDQIVTYLQAQSKGAQKMMGVLDASEAAGFTAGINYHSRELLLGGFREFWGALQKDVPGAKKAKNGTPAR